ATHALPAGGPQAQRPGALSLRPVDVRREDLAIHLRAHLPLGVRHRCDPAAELWIEVVVPQVPWLDHAQIAVHDAHPLLDHLLLVPSAGVRGASHREAPLIALDPAADNTDVYAFRSWVDPSKVVFILNVIPGQHPGDGPNYFNFDDDVLYRIHIDNNMDGVAEDIVYEIRFTTETRPALGSLNFPLPYVGNPHIPVAQLQGITALDGPGSEGLTRRQTYAVTEVRGTNRIPLFQTQKLVA